MEKTFLIIHKSSKDDKVFCIASDKKLLNNFKFNLQVYFMVPTPGLEPGRPYGQGILSPLRLPIPPSGHLNYHKSSSILYIISLLLSMLQNFFRLFFIAFAS